MIIPLLSTARELIAFNEVQPKTLLERYAFEDIITTPVIIPLRNSAQ